MWISLEIWQNPLLWSKINVKSYEIIQTIFRFPKKTIIVFQKIIYLPLNF